MQIDVNKHNIYIHRVNFFCLCLPVMIVFLLGWQSLYIRERSSRQNGVSNRAHLHESSTGLEIVN